jgi:opacity protein-like surface antigen
MGVNMAAFRRLILIILILFIASSVNAANLDFGLKLGLNNTWLTNTEKSYGFDGLEEKYYTINGPTFGIYFEERLSAFHTIRTEVVYTQKKWHSIEYQDYYGNHYYAPIMVSTAVNYIACALLLKIFPINLNATKPYICLGPELSMHISDSRTIKELVEYPHYSSDLDVGNNYGFALGGGLEFSKTRPLISLEIRWVGGLKYSAYSNGGDGHGINTLLVTIGVGLKQK